MRAEDAGTMRRLQGYVAVVTGGANGIGLGCALRMAREGANIAIFDREAAALAAAEPLVAAHGGRMLMFEGDCCDARLAERFVAETERCLGPIDILVNNVGQSARERQVPFLQSDETVWRFVFEVNFFTTIRFCRLILPGMVARKHGAVVNISSEDALIGVVRNADYGAAKMAVHGLARALAREVAPAQVTVNTICPGPILTRALQRGHAEVVEEAVRTIPLGFIGEPEDVAAWVAFLASAEGRFITGQVMVLNGGRWWV
jgi:acetoacetyl-CoA reductase/3-oxoacyl-[acyl-carrier protein] reductase